MTDAVGRLVPIKDRIKSAMGDKRTIGYFDLMDAVFPRDHYPRARNYSLNGGPPGCAMALGRALRELGLSDSGMGHERIVSRQSE
jgi:hypothetical protein